MRPGPGRCLWLLLTTALACSSDPPPPEPCRTDLARLDLEALDDPTVRVHLDGAGAVPSLTIVAADLLKTLHQVWGLSSITVESAAPDFKAPHTIWLSTSTAAREIADVSRQDLGSDGFALRRLPHQGTDLVLVVATTTTALAHGAYAFLEKLGVRYFHPLAEHHPLHGRVVLPKTLDVTLRPAFALRGTHFHLLHPTEYFAPFNIAGDDNLANAKRVVDWIVKTGQNYVQWPILATMDLEPWLEHGRAIIEYAHLRGVKAGVEPVLFGRAALQNNFVLARSSERSLWEAEIARSVDFLLRLDWDHIELAPGEFLSADPGSIVEMLNYIVDYVARRSGGETTVSMVNHVGDFPEIWVEYEGRREFFYFLTQYADPRLVESVHTVFFFDLFRGWGGYGHQDFSMHREFLFSQLGEHPVRYKPESAYWASADVDVPVFLPEYIHSRWVDINGLAKEVKSRGLPAIQGHVLFSSGHEWGYWMTDYLVAKMLWEPEADLDRFVGHVADAFGSCGEEAQVSLRGLIALQTEYLFDRRLAGYVTGEDVYDDLGVVLGLTTHPVPLPFEDLLTMTADARQDFETRTLGGLRELVDKTAAIESSFASICDRSDDRMKAWCSELLDGTAITRLRALHSALLFEAVLASFRARADAAAPLQEAARVRDEAALVIGRREASYRFDRRSLVDPWPNPTIYPWGYLRQANTMCFWTRPLLEAESIINTRTAALVTDLPTCTQ